MTSAFSNHIFELISVSQPSPGTFNIDDVECKSVHWQNNRSTVAFCVASSRIADLIQGEENRANCKLVVTAKGKGYIKYLCSCGKLRGKAAQDKQDAGPSQVEAGHKRSTLSHGESCKRGCEYWLKHIELPDREGASVVGVVLNVQGKHNEQVDGARLEVLRHDKVTGSVSTECRFWVRRALQDQLSVSQIIRGNNSRLLAKHANGSTDQMTIAAAIAETSDARDYALTRHDITNERTKISEATFQRCQQDHHSVAAHVAEDLDKPQSQQKFLLAELGERVRIVMATGNMQEWTVKYGHDRPVSVDCTFGITRYGYAVFTITGMDDTQRGLPLAFAILTGEGEEDFVAVLQVVRDRARTMRADWCPSVFLTDDSQAEQNAVKRIFGQDIPVHLCTYHVTAAWHKQICQKATQKYHNVAGISEIFRDIHSVMKLEPTSDKASSTKAVNEAMDAFLQKWLQLGETAIHDYFKKEWAPRVELWALAIRAWVKTLNQRTTGLSEGWHSFLKRLLKGCPAVHQRRIDWVIWQLTEVIEQHYTLRLSVHAQGFGHNAKAEKQLINSAVAMSAMKSESLTLICKEGGRFDAVYTGTDVTYRLEAVTTAYASCSCLHSIDGNFCKHQLLALQKVYFPTVAPTVAEQKLFRKACVRYLGSDFGRASGCSTDDISPVTAALQRAFPNSIATISLPDSPDPALQLDLITGDCADEMLEETLMPSTPPHYTPTARPVPEKLTPGKTFLANAARQKRDLDAIYSQLLDPNTDHNLRRRLGPQLQHMITSAQLLIECSPMASPADSLAVTSPIPFQLPCTPQTSKRHRSAAERPRSTKSKPTASEAAGSQPFSKTPAALKRQTNKPPKQLPARRERQAQQASQRPSKVVNTDANALATTAFPLPHVRPTDVAEPPTQAGVRALELGATQIPTSVHEHSNSPATIASEPPQQCAAASGATLGGVRPQQLCTSHQIQTSVAVAVSTSRVATTRPLSSVECDSMEASILAMLSSSTMKP